MKIKLVLLSLTLLFTASANAQYQQLPPVVVDASRSMIRNCFVKLNVSGWANQLYVNNRFAGNFRNGAEDRQLADALYQQLNRGVCFYNQQPYPQPNPPYPQPQPRPQPQPQFCTCTLSNQWGNFRAVGPNCNSATVAVVNACANSNRQAVCSASQVRCY